MSRNFGGGSSQWPDKSGEDHPRHLGSKNTHNQCAAPATRVPGWLSEEAFVRATMSQWRKTAQEWAAWHQWQKYCPGAIPQPSDPLRDIFPPANQLEGEEQLHAMLLCALQHANIGDWATRLREKFHAIRMAACATNLRFDPPKIALIPKAGSEKRALAIYGWKESLIMKLAARALSDQIDHHLCQSCLAYRRSSEWKKERALRHIHELATSPSRIFVGECDLKQCFDCVGHDTIRNAIAELSGRIAAEGGELDPAILRVIEAFLKSYSFPKSVLSLHPYFEEVWPREELRDLNSISEDIGIAQGAALSGALLNIVLSKVDRAMKSHEQVTYYRYADDTIILAPSAASCDDALKDQTEIHGKLGLPIWPLMTLEPYIGEAAKLQFWNSKSKGPYAWGDDISAGEYPRMAFVGFRFDRSGVVSLTPKTIKKRKQKIREIADLVIEHFKISRHLSTSPIKLYREMVLKNSFGPDLNVPPTGVSGKTRCWFKHAGQLKQWRYDTKFLRDLDRCFRKNEARISKALNCRLENQSGLPAKECFFHLFHHLPKPQPGPAGYDWE